MRFTQEGIEFILPESNRIDTVKTGLFNRALAQNDFVPPMTRIWSPANRTDLEQQGFFLNDSKGNLFRLSMSEGAPVVEPLDRPDDKEILLMSFCDEEDFLAIAVTTDGSSYLLPRDRSGYNRLPLPSFLGKSVSLSGNLFYYFFTLESDDSTQYVVIDKSLHPIDRYAAEQIIPESTFDLSAYLFPVRIMQSAYTGIKARIGDPAKFLIMNLLLALLTFCIRRRQKYSVAVQLIDTLIVALFGICGMAGAFAIPYRRQR